MKSSHKGWYAFVSDLAKCCSAYAVKPGFGITGYYLFTFQTNDWIWSH